MERVGFGRYQVIVLVAFVAIKISDGMELAIINLMWRDMPKGEFDDGCHVRVHTTSKAE